MKNMSEEMKKESIQEDEKKETVLDKEMSLKEIRSKLDEVDRQIVELYQQRMELSIQVAESKMRSNRPIRDVRRENQKLEMVKSLVQKGSDKKNVEELFRMLMSASRKYQYHLMSKYSSGGCRIPFQEVDELPVKDCRVVYTGVEGAFAHEATLKYFGKDVISFHVPTFEESMNALSGGRGCRRV